MLPYWLLFGLFAIGSLGSRSDTARKLSLPLAVSALILTLFIGLRYEVGADWHSYLLIFRSSEFMSLGRLLQKLGDPGFYSLMWLSHQLGYGIWAVHLVCALIFVTGLVAFAKRTSNPWLCIAVAIPYLVIVVAMSGVRQATAIGLCFLALNAFSDRRLIAAALWIILASLFHASAIIMLGIAALSFTQDRLKSTLILILTVGVGYFALQSSFQDYAYRYSKDVQSSGTIFRLIMNLLPALIFLKYKARFNLEPHAEKLWLNLSYLSILSIPLLFVIPSSTALDRFSLYLIPLQCFVLPASVFLFARRQNHVPLVTMVVLAYLAGAMFVFLNYSSNAGEWIPYQFYPLVDDLRVQRFYGR